MFNFEEELKNLPDSPGVYIMHGECDEVIYVGKAKILKNRVRQYFHQNKNHSPKVIAMVANVKYFEYIVTDSEVEALVLECNLIKKYRPKYNILLKDDKQYPYIKVSINNDYPKVYMTRTLKNDGGKYFGPYTGMQTVRTTLEIIQKIFKPPTCNRKFPEDIGKGRPCLNYHINNCFAPCLKNKVSKDEYRKVFFDICSFLSGSHEKLINELENEMKSASKNMEFEKAAVLRDKIVAIQRFSEKQKITNTDKQTDMDLVAIEKSDKKSFVEMFFVRKGKIFGHRSYIIDDTLDMQEGEILSDFIKQFYAEAGEIPKEILTEHPVSDDQVIEKWLSSKKGSKITVTSPVRGEKKKLIQMVHKNAEISADNYRIKASDFASSKNKGLMELSKKLNLSIAPKRIEAYDISNISGSDNVASMVVFIDGKPSKKDYRNFKIKSHDGINDYMSMQEVIYRRFRHGFEEMEKVERGEVSLEDCKFLPLPDLVLLDGGKGHLSSVMEIIEAIGIEIPVFGMVKDNKHRTRALVSINGEIEISLIDSVFNLITRIQEEVHRSAIGYHRKLRSKNLEKSQLDEIKGIGKVKKAKLLSHFKSVEGIKQADISELLKVVDSKTARNIVDYFQAENS